MSAEYSNALFIRLIPSVLVPSHFVQNQHASPTPQAVFQAAPATHIMDEDDEVERASLLPELQRVLTSVNHVLSSAIPADSRHTRPEAVSGLSGVNGMNGLSSIGRINSTSSGVIGTSGMSSLNSMSNMTGAHSSSPSSDTSHLPWRYPNHGIGTNISCRTDPRSRLDGARLRQLAPLIDRLGRTLTDAAPHIASLADSLPSVASSLGSVSAVDVVDSVEADPIQNLTARASHLYFGMDDTTPNNGDGSPIPSERPTLATTPVTFAAVASSALAEAEDETANDPDLTDYINGMVNITRGETRSGRDTTRDPIGTSLLASYLSSSGVGGINSDNDDIDNPLGRVVRVGSGNGNGFSGGGPGIDIHIHAMLRDLG